MSDVTRLLDAVERGEHQAAEELLPLVYEELRFFAGLAQDEIAQILGLSDRSTRRLWAFARAWHRHLKREHLGTTSGP